MRIALGFCCFMFGLVSFALAKDKPFCSATDDIQNTTVLKTPARRIITLAPNLTELVYAAGAGSYLIATDSSSDYPKSVKKLPKVGRFDGLNIERIIRLKPDLILAWDSGNPRGDLEHLKKLGLNVFISDPRSLLAIPKTLKKLGCLTGTTIANTRANQFIKKLNSLRQYYSHKKSVSVFFIVWPEPLMTINGQHIISKVIDLCGGRNIFAMLGPLVPRVNLEAVIARQPELIIGGRSLIKRAWGHWRTLKAVKNHAIVKIDSDLITRAGPRILQGALQICRAIDQIRAKRRSIV